VNRSRIKTLLLSFDSPWIELALGLILVVTSGYQLVHELLTIADPQLGAHHGVTIFGLITVLRSLGHIAEGTKQSDAALRARLARPSE
jgi:hypothetical protein